MAGDVVAFQRALMESQRDLAKAAGYPDVAEEVGRLAALAFRAGLMGLSLGESADG